MTPELNLLILAMAVKQMRDMQRAGAPRSAMHDQQRQISEETVDRLTAAFLVPTTGSRIDPPTQGGKS